MFSRPRRRLGVAAGAATALVVALLGAVVPATAAAGASSCTSSLTVSQVQDRILADVNAARSRVGVKALRANAAMDSVALKWSQRQAADATMKHNPNYSTQIPAGWSAAGENVAFGYSPTTVTRAWLDSPGHRANILRSSFTHIGIGVGCSESGRPYYTQVFGAYKILTTTAPAISGTPKAGITLTAKTGTWTTGTTLKYQWYADGSSISGATAKTYTPKSTDAGKTVKVKVTGVKTGYAPTARVSQPTDEVAKLSTLTTVRPRVSGVIKVGEELLAVRGVWTTGTTYYYRWYRDSTAISGATGKRYVLTKSDRGHTITVKVTGKKAGYATASRVAAKTPVP
ncbi:MAG: CAP domain-containing protein [Candidatus Microbacterium phytovorans]|uniref:CAP domain-containing protein n=1 Tax=Candidatus Microbacterium phytovorans TaxID=3121374 RepID=A0AAJ5W116_9MICO|nr:CAP domain-containing protein [Microbacterium sp.]WEK13600.1 MAG: CAP domain-containing protein [Microbacterium sp.]